MILMNGLYWHASDDANTYLRFYSDGRVIEVSSTGSPQDLVDWFHWHSDSASRGMFFVLGQEIALTSTSEYGTVAYCGRIISPHSLMLGHYSFINGYIAHERGYEFVEVPFSH
jgi:hypothetical protein